jgi:hypothetical protein
MKFLFLLLRGSFLAAIALLASLLLTSCAVSGPDGGVVSVDSPRGSGVVVDPPGPAGISVGGY